MKVNELHPSKYLKAADLEQDTPVVIRGIKVESLKDNDGNEEDKPVLYFRNVEKGLVLNPTNKKRILAQYPAEDTDEWNGKTIVLTKEWVEAFGKADWAIRVKMTPPVAAVSPPESAAARAVAGALAGAANIPCDSTGKPLSPADEAAAAFSGHQMGD